jgi:hypothetical protein
VTHGNEASHARLDSIGESTTVVGILPLVHIRHWLFGNSLVSMPFCDAGGVLATDAVVERMLVEHGLRPPSHCACRCSTFDSITLSPHR